MPLRHRIPVSLRIVFRLFAHRTATVGKATVSKRRFAMLAQRWRNIDMRSRRCRRMPTSPRRRNASWDPGLSTDVKLHLWKTIGRPTLLYGMETFTFNVGQTKTLEGTQASIIKRLLGLPNRSHNSNLLAATGTVSIKNCIDNNVLSLWKRIFKCDTPTRSLCVNLLNELYEYNRPMPGTLLQRVVSMGISPVKAIFQRYHMNVTTPDTVQDGVVDSLKYLISYEQFIKPYPEQHIRGQLPYIQSYRLVLFV